MKILSILLLIGITFLWFIGKNQPIVVVEQNSSREKQVACPKCAGSGSVEVPAACPKCKGSGKTEPTFKPIDKQTAAAKCFRCRGTGKNLERKTCPQCRGTGRVAGSEELKTKTVKADLSLWEKTLAVCLVKPDQNCKPQRRLDGSYPIVLKYIEIFVRPEYNPRVIKWENARLEGKEWIIRAEIEFKGKNGQWERQSQEFIIENREVKGNRKAN